MIQTRSWPWQGRRILGSIAFVIGSQAAAQVEPAVWPLPGELVLLRLEAPDASDVWGWSVAGAGDVDGDGHCDLAIADFEHGSGGSSHGRLDIVSGRDGS